MSGPLAILIDTTKCTGCDDCVVACKRENKLGKDVPRRWKQRIDDLSSTRYTTVLQRKGGHYVRQFCRHCVQPACASVCPVGALHKTPEGPVTYEADRCIGCRYCMNACPYSIPRYDWEKAVPYVRKCTMCRDRVLAGKRPACVDACRYEVADFGPRDVLLQKAHARILGAPNRYIDKVYGESEVGGTSVLYISNVALGFLSYRPDLPEQPLPELTWSALSKVPPIALAMTGLMAGAWWATGRRMQRAREAVVAASASESSAAPTVGAEADQQGEPKQ